MSEESVDGLKKELAAEHNAAVIFFVALVLAAFGFLFLLFHLKGVNEERDGIRAALFQWAKRADATIFQATANVCAQQQPSDITGCLAKSLVDQAPGTGGK